MRVTALAALATLGLDQLTKVAVVHGLNLFERGEIDVWPPFLNFRMAWNRGINFGLFQGHSDLARWILIVLALAISVWVWLWVRKLPPRRTVQISAGLLIGGALGNVIDRLIYGSVADFLNMSCCGFENPYSFNIADVTIFAGALGLAVFAGNADAGKPPSHGKPPRKTP